MEKALLFRLIDFGTKQVFKSRTTYTCICLISNQPGNILYTKSTEDNKLPDGESGYSVLQYENLDHHNGWNLQKNEVISKIESIGTSFGSKYMTRNGIATLKNRVYIFKPVRRDSDYFYLQDGDVVWPIERGICKNIINPNKLVTKSCLRDIKEKIIFPYSFKIDGTEAISESHFKKEYPNAYEYLHSKKKELANRDKGKGKKYDVWFLFGRNQSLEKLKYKLFFPHISPKIPNYLINTDEELLFYNGIAVIGKNKVELEILKKIMQSRLFWFYITNSSKPYGSDYYSLSKNYIKNFGIYDFSKDEEKYILKEECSEKLNAFFENKYGISL